MIADSINLLKSHFTEFWSFAVSKGFKVYVAELPRYLDVSRCAARNVHGWSKQVDGWLVGWLVDYVLLQIH